MKLKFSNLIFFHFLQSPGPRQNQRVKRKKQDEKTDTSHDSHMWHVCPCVIWFHDLCQKTDWFQSELWYVLIHLVIWDPWTDTKNQSYCAVAIATEVKVSRSNHRARACNSRYNNGGGISETVWHPYLLMDNEKYSSLWKPVYAIRA